MSIDKEVFDDQTVLLSNTVIKLGAIERILKAKGLLTDEEITIEMKKIVEQVSAVMLANSVSQVTQPFKKPEN